MARQSVFPAWADEPEELATPRFSLRGFGTLGMARSSSDQADFVRDLSQPDGSRGQWTGKVDSLLGVQANYRFDDRLEGVVQVASRYRYDKSFRPEVGWAFLKYDPDPGLSLRAGRIGTEFYMLADSRLIGYSYLPVRPPTDYFTPLPIYYMNGGDATLTVPVAPGLAKFKAFYGVAGEKIPIADWVWDFSGSRMFGGYVDYLQGAWQWRLSYAQLRFRHDFPINEVRGGLRLTGVPSAIAAADALSVADRRAHYYSAGVVYDKGPVQAQLMFSRTTQESALFEGSSAGYGLLAYRVSSLTPYLGFSRVRSSANPLTTGLPDAVPPFAALNGGVAAIMRQTHVDQRTLFAGVRWDVRPNVAVKLQWDRVRGEPGSVAFQQGESPAWNGRTDVLSLTLDFVF
ncbi:MAG: hypothetical protein HYZ17_11565 [Betaproteobacteria bacterium]|nr:hypothetical protein [Betaproteobacteria bacterium]